MNSILKYKEKGYSVPRLKIMRVLFWVGERVTKGESFRRSFLQCMVALGDFEKTEKELLEELKKKDCIDEAILFFIELYKTENREAEGLEKIYELGKTEPHAYLVKRIATWLDDTEEKEKALVLYMELIEHEELTSLEEIDLIEIMEFFMEIKNYPVVITLGEKILEKKPDLMRVAYMRAESYELIGNIQLAKDSFVRMLERGKKKMSAEEYRVLQHLCNMHLGNIGITEAEPLTARKYFLKAEATGIDKKEAVRGRAIACFQGEDHEGAIEAYDVLETEFDMKFASYYGKGVAYKAMGKIKEAKSWLLQAEELEPENQSVLYNLSHIEYLDENNEIALELIDRALETDPEDPDTLYGKAMVFTAMHKYGDAIVIFDEVLKKKTESAEIYCRKADALRHLGRLDEAAYNYDVALQKNIGLTEAYYGKGMVLAAKGDLSEALQVMDDTISINQGFMDAYIGRSMIQMYFNDVEDGSFNESDGLKN